MHEKPEKQKNNKNNIFLSSKPHFVILDGLRGIASIILVIYHFSQVYSNGIPAEQILNHSYLAVEFFYLLSGYVLGYAYDNRWGKMTYSDFFKRRLIRLHPMIIIANIIGIGYYFLGESEIFPKIENVSPLKLILAIILSLLNLPAPEILDIRGYKEINGILTTSWTLQYEYLINILYAFIFRKSHTYIILFFTFLSSFLTINLTLNLDIFNILKGRGLRKYTVIGGWELSPCELYIGFTRLFFPFFSGYLIYRLNLNIKIKYSFLITSILLIISLSFPRVGGDNWIYNGVYESIIILIIFPVIIMIGVGNKEKNKVINKISNFLGEFSYPLYITHYPLLYVNGAWNTFHYKDRVFNKIGVSFGIFIIIIFNTYASYKIFDIPVRKWLSNKYLFNRNNIVKNSDEENKQIIEKIKQSI